MDKKIIGYLLLGLGLLLIIFSLYNVYSVFSGRFPPIKLFNQTGISVDLAEILGSEMISDTRLDLLSAATINGIFNYSFHLLFMSFISITGFRIASLGGQLLRSVENLPPQSAKGS